MDSRMYYVPVTKNLVGGVRLIKDINGNDMLYTSPTACQTFQSDVPPAYFSDRELIINNIDTRVATFGWSASKTIGMDELDNTIYEEEEPLLLSYLVKYANTVGIHMPYDLIISHEKNKWKLDCFNLCFYNYHNIMPHSCHSIPRKLKIKRSDGSIQNGILSDNLGLIVRTSKSNCDTNDRIYVIVSFCKDNPDEEDEKLFMHHKSTPLEALIDYKDFGTISMEPPQLKLSEGDSIQKDVELHYTKQSNKWGNDILLPVVNRFNTKFPNKIDLKIKN